MPEINLKCGSGMIGTSQTRLFVYGSLRKGQRAHDLIHNCPFRGTHKTAPGFELYDFGAYPGMVQQGEGQVVGEVYVVGPMGIQMLDYHEGHPHYYERKMIRLEDGTAVKAYLMRPEQVEGKRIITSGDWCKREDD